MKSFVFLGLFCFLMASCSLDEGQGGNSVITGKVFVEVYNNSFTHVLNTYYKPEADVYIIYGNGDIYSERYRTNWDGSYRFDYLRKGDYKIFAYSLDTTGSVTTEDVPVFMNVNLSGNNKTVTLDDLVVIEKCDYDDGTASITGKLFIRDFNNDRTILIQEYYGPDERVYIVYGDDPFHFNDVRTHFDGTFRFENLVKGTYTIYALSNDMVNKLNRQLLPVSVTVTIDQDYQKKDIGNIIVYK